MSTVFALATPPSKSAIAVFRITGDGCHSCFSKIFKSPPKKERFFYVKNLYSNNGVVDKVGCVIFKSPDSYTGEDSFELHTHGSLGVMSRVGDVLKGCGFEEAPPGEFTKRSFLNNKITLNEAESIADLIDCSSPSDIYLSSASVSGGFSKNVFLLSDKLNQVRLMIEGEIDFSDEDVLFLDAGFSKKFSSLVDSFSLFLSSCVNREMAGHKNKIVFVGPPNTGKSSIFNRLLGYERAITSNSPGTTRDFLESEMFFENTSFKIIDSAGIRKSSNSIEKKGMEASQLEAKNADVVVGVFDEQNLKDVDYFSTMSDGLFLKVLNKSDLGYKNTHGCDCVVSAKNGDGFDEFKKALFSHAVKNKNDDKKFILRARQIKHLNSSFVFLKNAYIKFKDNENLELIAEDLKLSRGELDCLLGVKKEDELIGDIFSKFCIGK